MTATRIVSRLAVGSFRNYFNKLKSFAKRYVCPFSDPPKYISVDNLARLIRLNKVDHFQVKAWIHDRTSFCAKGTCLGDISALGFSAKFSLKRLLASILAPIWPGRQFRSSDATMVWKVLWRYLLPISKNFGLSLNILIGRMVKESFPVF